MWILTIDNIAGIIRAVKLSQGVEWALHCTALIAQAPDGAAVPRKVLAEHYRLPDAYLAKHLHALVRAGVLHASTGPNGGFRLTRPTDAITALDIVEAVEGGSSPFVCQEIRQRGEVGEAAPREAFRRPCGIATIMGRAHRAWQDSLRGVTLSDLVAMTPPRLRERNRAKFTPQPRG